MKKILKQFTGMIILAALLVSSFSVTARAAGGDEEALHKYPYGFEFVGGTAYKINAGDTKEVWMWSRLNYTWYVSNHTSKGTYLECSCKRNTETIKIHIGADETVGTIDFFLYPDEDGYRSGDAYVTLEVYVQNRNPVYTDPNVATLKAYAGNNAEFNAWYYYVNYPDLQAAFGLNGDALLNHWNNFGKKEMRVANKFK